MIQTLVPAYTVNDLLEKIDQRTCRVGIVGLGYVGLPLMWKFHEKRMPVIIATNHSDIDYAQLAEWAPLIVDTRNAMNGKGTTKPGQVWKA